MTTNATNEEQTGLVKPVRPVNNQNANAMFICENGHLQYNLTEADKDELTLRGMPIPPVVYDGGKCRNCGCPVTPLTTDVLHLQQKLGTALQNVAALRLQMAGFRDANVDQNTLALFLRQNYGYEIEMGQPQHAGRVSMAVIYYLQRERQRLSVRAARFGRWLLRMVGAA
jgi:hypothetical protein